MVLQAPGAPLGAWDRAGLWLSGLCAVHCFLVPVLLLALPVATALDVAHEAAHPLLAVMLGPVTLGALVSRRGAAGGSGLLLLGLAVVWLGLPAHALSGEIAETVLTGTGSALLVAGHLRHWKGSRSEDSGGSPADAHVSSHALR